MHNAESHAGGFVHAFWEAYAIVVHRQRGAVLSRRQGQDNVVCLPMFDGVTHGFLRNAIEMRGDCMVRRRRQAVTCHPTGDAKEAFCLQSQILQGHNKTIPFQLNGREAVHEFACPGHGLVS
jgi:hypothetical protein